MKDIYEVIKKPLITEKSTLKKEKQNQVAFCVNNNANKIEIREAVERLFKVKVEKVNTLNVLGKRKRRGRIIGKRPDWKKAMVTLSEGERIEFFEGM